MPDTAYAQCGDLSLAYQVFGEGEIELVFAGSFVSHVELMWTLPEAKTWFDQLGSFCRVLLFDKAGVGLSDPVPGVRSIEDRAAELEAVMDATGFGRAVMMGVSEGGPAAIVFAAARPDRVRSLILTGTFPCMPAEDWSAVEDQPGRLVQLARGMLGAEYEPSAEQVAQIQEFGRSVRTSWGSGEALRILLPSVRSLRQLGALERMCASPGMARATIEAVFRLDVRPVLPSVSVPTLVVHATGDPIPIQFGRYLADHIPNARLVEVDGADHAPWFSDPDRISEAIEDFLTGAHGASSQSRRALRTVLFSDMVASTARAAAIGDERWRTILQRFGEITTDLAERFGGRVVKSTGDGHLATFEGPTQAIRCAEALRAEIASLEVEIRIGIHTGECELIGDDIGGIAVHIAARVMSQAAPAEILVSSPVRDLVVGSGIGFEQRGVHELRGIPGQWQLLAVDSSGPRPGSREAELVALPTPSPHTAMRPSDRVVATVARRTPWLLRGLAHLAPARAR
ncbi:MAG: adenylate/guanylate cyclase domain-containing protein [Solirubrobacteraceae bacterium]